MIDSGFANSISIESIAVYGIILNVAVPVYMLYSYGTYAFRITGNRANACMRITLLSSVLISIFICIFHVEICRYYVPDERTYLADLYKSMFLFGLSVPFVGIGDNLRNYMIYSAKRKICAISSIMYYLIMIFLDAVAVIIFKSVIFVVAATLISDIFFAFTMWFISGFYKEKYKKGDFSYCLNAGLSYWISRMSSGASMFIIGVASARLGTLELAICTVARKCFEIGSKAIQASESLGVLRCRGKNYSALSIWKSIKDTYIMQVAAFAVLCFVPYVTCKGKLSNEYVLIPTVIVCSVSMATYLSWIMLNVKLVSDNIKNMMIKVAIIRFIVAISIFVLSKKFGMYPILLYSFLSDFATSAFGWFCVCKK